MRTKFVVQINIFCFEMEIIMTEDRHEHTNEISNRIIPKIPELMKKLEHGETPAELNDLSIQDLIVICDNTGYAINRHLFAGDDWIPVFQKFIDILYHIVIERLLESKSPVWVMFDHNTELPFIDAKKSFWLFSEKEFAEECLDYFLQQYRTTFFIKEIVPNDIQTFLAHEFYYYGAKSVTIDNGQAFMALAANDVIKAPDYTGVPQIKVPVTNPDLVRAVCEYFQEAGWHVNYPGRERRLQEYKYSLGVELKKARFLVPAKGLKGPAQGNVKVEKDIALSVPIMSYVDTEISLTPAFTDWTAFDALYNRNEWSGWIWTIKDLMSAPTDKILICFGTAGTMTVSRDTLKSIAASPDNESVRKEPLTSAEINRKLQKNVIADIKVPHGVSQPVLRYQDGKYYLAVFVFFYNSDDIKSGMVRRPCMWVLADLATGDIVKRFDTRDDLEFSNAPYDIKYNIRSDTKFDTSKEYYDKAFRLLDSVRIDLLTGKEFSTGMYNDYLEKIVANIPDEYKRFYIDLSQTE